jgi:gas vesicle protein
MGRFLAGLIIGVVLGIAAMAVNPDLPRELRVAFANATAYIMRGAEDAAESVGEAADDVAREADEAIEPVPEPEPEPAPTEQQ